MLGAIAASLIQAMPAGADPTVVKMMDLEPVLAAGPPFRRLFLDAMVVEESGGLERVFHPATKYEGNPIFGRTDDWEGWGPCGINTVKDGDKLRMYYFCIGGHKEYPMCVAESEDGINWTKPVVGEIEWNGSKRNNIVTALGQVMQLAHPPSPDRKMSSASSSTPTITAWRPRGNATADGCGPRGWCGRMTWSTGSSRWKGQ